MPITPIRATTQDHLDIEDIHDDLILLKDGSAAMVLQTSSVNFGLLSEEEQDATIYAYAALLNSLTFPIQILVRSQKKDVTNYLKLLEEQEKKLGNPLLRNQIGNYKKFVEKTVREGNVLDKKFYIIIPFSYLELGVRAAAKKGLLQKNQSTYQFPKDQVIKKVLTTLKPKRDHVIRQFSRLGLKARQLKTEELIKLLYSLYNPDAKPTREFTTSKAYTAPLVQAAVEESAAPPTTPQPPPSRQ